MVTTLSTKSQAREPFEPTWKVITDVKVFVNEQWMLVNYNRWKGDDLDGEDPFQITLNLCINKV